MAVGIDYVFVVAFVVVVLAWLAGVGHLLSIPFQLAAAPGTVVHEFAHEQACDLVGVPVVEVKYFGLGNPAGYVRHGQPERYRETFVISVAPFLVNTVISFVAFLGLAAVTTMAADGRSSPLELLEVLRSASTTTLALVIGLGWVGLAVGVRAFPSFGDANTLWTRSRSEWRRSPIVLVGIPVVVAIYVVNILSWLWADLLYAVGIGIVAFAVVGTVGI
ncbi:metalloprotease family protein [Natrinema salsiterrestre]|uniref:Metalloprotease family protein n=1 Tax=Natrinema salsiterrestre TaxID=2950540 RepID=A0A9Q4Q249_9EURY|nr:metalloprotease family protein [Natrinema salsiterrestre]MDF9744933.1 metalloprotease family protein [Natrinema salsiterrestre]